MERPALTKNVLMASLLIAGMNLWTSCDSCSRKEAPEDSGTYTTETDTLSTETSVSTETTSGTSSTASGTGNSADGTAKSGSTASGTTATPAATGKKGLTEQEITDQIENSSSTPRDANGRPVNSGGTSGSGMGTGTGSTGNNSKVTRPEDQKN